MRFRRYGCGTAECSRVGENAEQWIAATASHKRATHQNCESRGPENIFNLSLDPFLHVGIAFHSRNRCLNPFRFGTPMYGGKQQSMRSQNCPETRQGLFNIAGTNVKKAERSPKTVEACLGKFQMPHIHFFTVAVWTRSLVKLTKRSDRSMAV